MNERTFVLGVGAQKAGTTWLHSYVASSANANMGFTKEYHIWDAVCSPLCNNFRLHKHQLSKLNTLNYLRYCMQEIPGFYEGYFNSIFNSGAKITGDITPSYSVLTEGDFHKIKDKINFKLVIIGEGSEKKNLLNFINENNHLARKIRAVDRRKLFLGGAQCA